MSAMLREPALLKQLKDMAETHAIELRAYEATVANLEHQLETERMRLVACGVIALANTPESAAQAREMLPEYWSASAKDCADMVDREMALRERIRQMEAERVPSPSCRECANRGRVNGLSQETYCDSCVWQGQSFRVNQYAAATQPKKEGE